jgi:hypothetical protein
MENLEIDNNTQNIKDEDLSMNTSKTSPNKNKVLLNKRRSIGLSSATTFTEEILSGKKTLLDLILTVENFEVIQDTRKLLWMIFLDILPIKHIDSWTIILKDKRNKYTNIIFSEESDKVENKELLHIITLDVSRTYQEFDLFKDELIKKCLIRVLFTWAFENSDLKYVQGMNELAGTLLYVIYSNLVPNNTNEQSFHYLLNCEEYLEHDLYTMFDNLMKRCFKELYNYSEKRIKDMKYGQVDGFVYVQESNLSSLEKILREDVSSLRKRINRIFSFYLKITDKEVYDLIIHHDIEPYLFIFRWILCLLTREFKIDNLLKLWDVIFAFEKNEEIALRFFCNSNGIKVKNDEELPLIIPKILKGYKMYDFNFLDFLVVSIIQEIKNKLGKNADQCLVLSYIMHIPEGEINLKSLINSAINAREIVYQRLLEENNFVFI